MEVSKLYARIREELEESGSGVFFTDADLNDSLEDGYTLFCLFTGLIDREYNLQIEANKVYYDISFLADFVRPVAIYNPNNKLFLKPISYLILNNQISGWETSVGTPLMFAYFPTQLLAFYPHYGYVPQEKLVVFYKSWPANFDSTANINLPAFAEDCLVYYCVSDLYDQLLEIEKSKLAWNKFVTDLQVCKRKINRLSIGSEYVDMGEINA